MKKIFLLFVAMCLGIFCYSHFYSSKFAQYKNLPLSDKNGIVLETKRITINGVPHPYNSSLIKEENGDYLLTFRSDDFVKEGKKMVRTKTHVGLVKLNKNFDQSAPVIWIDTKSDYSEDARIFFFNNDYYILYNDRITHKHLCRTMHIAKLNKETFQPEFITNLDLHIDYMEKNWVPFLYGSPGNEKIHLAYKIVPHKIMRLDDPQVNSIHHYVFPGNPSFKKIYWNWGVPRGGTPARLVNGEYLAFFHSSMNTVGKKRKYVMAAYTFSKEPPFQITKRSEFPIWFTDNAKHPIIFPSGFVEGVKDGKEVFYVSYGEDDCMTKIVTIDKKSLLKSMVSIDTIEP